MVNRVSRRTASGARVARPVGPRAGEMAEEQVDVLDVPEKSRVEIRVDGELAGFADYSRLGGRIIFRHTEIHDAYEGRGLGSKLAQGALDFARAAGHPVVPLCPFVASY